MYGFTITKQGRKLLASLLTGEQLRITDVQVGTGRVPDDQDPRDLTALVAPFPEPYCYATRTEEIRKNDVVSFIVEYRSDLNGGLDDGRYINEFGVYANDPEDGRILLYYANLGDYPEWVFAYNPVRPPDIRRYPVQIGVSTNVEVVFDFDAGAFVTSAEVHDMVEDLVSEATKTYASILNLTIPASGWVQADTVVDGREYICDVAADHVTAKQFPIGAAGISDCEIARKAGVADGCETKDGYVRFFSKRIPTGDITATIAILTNGAGGGGIATEDTPGVVMPGTGLSVDEYGTLSMDLGGGLVFDDDGKVTINTETVVTGDDLVNEDETEEDLKGILLNDSASDNDG